MKSKKSRIVLVGLVFVCFFFLVDFNCGWKYPSNSDCTLPGGYSKVYVHWFKLKNDSYAVYCNGESTPKFSFNDKEQCDC